MPSMMAWCGAEGRLAGALIAARDRRLLSYRPAAGTCLPMPVVGGMEKSAPVRARGVTVPPPVRPGERSGLRIRPEKRRRAVGHALTLSPFWCWLATNHDSPMAGRTVCHACNNKMGKDSFRGLVTAIPVPACGGQAPACGVAVGCGETLCRTSNGKIGRRLLPMG